MHVQQATDSGAAVLQQSASSPTQVDGPQTDPPAGAQAGQQTLPRLSQEAANQSVQQHHDEAQQLQWPCKRQQQLQQQGNTSDAPQSATATLARPGAGAWLRQHAHESADDTRQSIKPVAVLTSAVTGAGLKELLLQVERKVECLVAAVCISSQLITAALQTVLWPPCCMILLVQQALVCSTLCCGFADIGSPGAADLPSWQMKLLITYVHGLIQRNNL